MESLIESGLFGRGLLPVNQGSMVDRYNACLEDIGLPRTNLTSFHIDGWGWSPEVAQERNDKFYLSHLGAANPYAIILSPQQKGRPIYFPYHSFDWHMMKIIFDANESQIADLTTTSAIWVDVDQEISAYQEPQDLLMVDSITLRFNSIGGVMTAAREQRKLAHEFLNQRMAWSDPRLHESIIESVKEHGDLRFRSVELPDMPYSNTRHFFTRAFGGLFVFRDLQGSKPLLVMVDPEQAALSGELQHSHLEFALNDPALLGTLFREELLDLQLLQYRDNPEPVRRLMDGLLAEAIAADSPEVDLVNMRDGEKKKWMLQLHRAGTLSPAYAELERMLLMFSRGRDVEPSKLGGEVSLMLAHPHPSLKGTAWDAVRMLLVKLNPHDPVRTYEYDKELFFERYANWPKNLQTWVRDYLQKHRN
jgi:hypothetical protein